MVAKLEYVETGAQDLARTQSLDQRMLIDQRTTSRVDQDRRRLHQAQFRLTDDMACLRRIGRVQRDKISCP